ncbi:MAG: hypothetical protein IJ574_00620, partial [Bacilli bacterium]|nr:hypothetical protein [Bacilli bacterium]
MSKYKKITYIILIITLIVIGTSLALWIRIREQNGKNEVASTCISLEIDRNTEGDAITMDDAFPLTDIDGLKEKRYTFTIVNGCSSYIFYNINLESLTSVAEEERIPIEYIKAIIDNNPPITLNNYDEVNSLLSSGTAYDTRMLDNGILYGNESRTFNLKLWLDEDTPKDYMEHAYEAKVTVYGELMKIDYGPVNAVTYLTNKVSTDNDLVYDDAIDTENEANNNIRYVGANPNNYVWFNDELWRIIGVMKGVNGSSTDDGSGETRIKIIRDESLGRFPYSESCLNENMVNNGDGTYTCNNLFYNNNWPSSTVNKILNDLYWNRETHISFNGYMYVNNTWQDYKTEIIDFRLNGLKKTAQNLIEPAMYYLGGYTITSSDQYYYGRMDSKKWYEAERNNRSSNNELTWTGNLGLMYPS